MKKASTELFDLIKSLTANEKSYFKRYAVMHKSDDNAYLKLFEVMASQESYCEVKVKDSLKNEKLVGYFSRAKKYLYDKILDSMRLYNANKRMQRQLWDRYEDAYFLFSRRQYKPSLRRLKKIQKEAEASECWLVYTEALRLEAFMTKKSDNMLESIKVWNQKIKATFDKAYNTHHFSLIDKLMGYYWNAQNPMNARSSYHTFYDQYLSDGENVLKPSTVEAQIYALRCVGIYHKAFREFDVSYEKLKGVVQLFEDHPAVLKKRFLFYYYALETLISVDCDRFDQKGAALHLDKVRKYFFSKKSFILKDDFLKVKILPSHYFSKIVYCFKFALHDEALDTVKEGIAATKSCEHLVSEVTLLLLANMYFLVYIIHEQWENALHWIHYILSKGAKHHKLVLINAQIWELLIHLALENYQLLDCMLRNKIRAWKQDEVYVEYLQKIVKVTQQQMNQTYPEFWLDIGEASLENAGRSNYQGVDTIYAFSQSRLQKRNFEEVRRELIEEYIQKKASVEA